MSMCLMSMCLSGRARRAALLTFLAAGLALAGARPAQAQASSGPASVVLRADASMPVGLAPPAHSRWAAGPSAAQPSAAPQAEQVRTEILALSGVGGGTLGFLAGLGAGYVVGDNGEIVPAEIIFGPLIGYALGAPMGVHLANGRQGNYFLEALASGVLVAGGLFVASQVSGSGAGAVALIATASAPIVISIGIERAGEQQ